MGPKGCGKTTIAKHQAKSYIEFQNEDLREQLLETASINPSKLLIGDKPRLFDEWQDAPKIWGAIRKNIDDEEKLGLYILTGSTSNKIKTLHTSTLRISTMKMYPLSLYESDESNGEISLIELFNNPEKFDGCKSNLTIDDLIFAICRGGWPNCFKVSRKELKLKIAQDLFYQTCYVDVSNIDGVKRNPIIVQNLLRSYSRNLCTLSDYKTIIADINTNIPISERTFYNYLEKLEELYIVEDINAWCPSIRSKSNIRSSKKRNLVDPSIAVAAL